MTQNVGGTDTPVGGTCSGSLSIFCSDCKMFESLTAPTRTFVFIKSLHRIHQRMDFLYYIDLMRRLNEAFIIFVVTSVSF